MNLIRTRFRSCITVLKFRKLVTAFSFKNDARFTHSWSLHKTLHTLLSVVLFLIPPFLTAQETSPFYPNSIPSPTAKELGKYAAYPVNYYSGLPNINIPLYEFKCGTFILPISLNYHASGIKVNDIASWVGLGWSLSAGGCITVIPKGKFDFCRIRFGIRTKEQLQALLLPSDQEFLSLSERNIDAEPDIYSYNFCGLTGQFVFDADFNIHSLKNNSGIQFECIRTYHPNPCGEGDCGFYTAEFIATDMEGNIYHFKDFESTVRTDWARDLSLDLNQLIGFPQNQQSNSTDFGEIEATSWMLTEIELPNKVDKIIFKYKKRKVDYQTGYSGVITACDREGISCDMTKTHNFDWWGEYSEAIKYSTIEDSIQQLEKISFSRDTSKIVFNATLGRQDLPGAFALSEIEIWNPLKQIIKWKFGYTYFISDFTMFGQNHLKNRLRLDKLTKYSGDSTLSEPPYCFTYFGDDPGENKLPPRTCFDGFDHWGYSNCVTTPSNGSSPSRLFPLTESGYIDNFKFICVQDAYYGIPNATSSFFNGDSDPMPAFTLGGNRTPDGYYAKSFTLKAIKYPTGGFTKFDYEGNTYKKVFSYGNGGYASEFTPCGGIRIKRIVDSISGKSINTRLFDYGSGGVLYGRPFYKQPCFDNQYNNSSFMICGNDSSTLPPRIGAYNLYSNSVEPLSGFGAGNIGYSYVKETSMNGSTTLNGSTEYYYEAGGNSNFDGEYNLFYAYRQTDIIQGINSFYATVLNEHEVIYPFCLDFTAGEMSGKSYMRGSLQKVIYKNLNDTPVKEESLAYDDSLSQEYVVGNRVARINDSFYFIDAYYLKTGKRFLNNKTTKYYDPLGSSPITNVTSKQYSLLFEQEKTSIDTNSLGEVITTTYYYPNDIYTGTINGGGTPEAFGVNRLFDDHRLATPMEITKMKNGELIEASLTSYKTIDNLSTGFAVPFREYRIESEIPFTKIKTEVAYNSNNVKELKIDPKYVIKAEYEYDSCGNMIGFFKKDDIPICFAYGYSKTLLVIEVKNSTPDSLNAVLSEVGDLENKLRYVSDLNSANQREVWSKYNQDIRKHIKLKDALVTTYTYIPLIGITSSTNPDGIATYYEYDDLGRLKFIRDNQGNIIQKYEYHYQGE